MSDIHGKPIPEEPELVTPQTIGGMLRSKRYAELRRMGVKTEEIAALCMMHERGQFPGDRLFSAKKKKLLLDKNYKKLRLRTQKEILIKFNEMKGEWVESLRKAKVELEQQGIDFEQVKKEDDARLIELAALKNRDKRQKDDQ